MCCALKNECVLFLVWDLPGEEAGEVSDAFWFKIGYGKLVKCSWVELLEEVSYNIFILIID